VKGVGGSRKVADKGGEPSKRQAGIPRLTRRDVKPLQDGELAGSLVHVEKVGVDGGMFKLRFRLDGVHPKGLKVDGGSY